MDNEHTTTPAPTGGRPAVLAVVQHRRKVGSDLHLGAYLTMIVTLIIVTVSTDLGDDWDVWQQLGFGLLLSLVANIVGYAYGRIKTIHRVLTGGDRAEHP